MRVESNMKICTNVFGMDRISHRKFYYIIIRYLEIFFPPVTKEQDYKTYLYDLYK